MKRHFVWVDNGRGDYVPQLWNDRPPVGPKLKHHGDVYIVEADSMTLDDCIRKWPKPEFVYNG